MARQRNKDINRMMDPRQVRESKNWRFCQSQRMDGGGVVEGRNDDKKKL